MPVRCVIVDDNQDFLRAASDLLRRDGINVVGLASSGAQAHDVCGELRPDVVLVDIQLGGESGFDVARHLVGEAVTGRPRVILISAFSMEDFGDMIGGTPKVAFLPKADLSAMAVLGILARAGDSFTGR